MMTYSVMRRDSFFSENCLCRYDSGATQLTRALMADIIIPILYFISGAYEIINRLFGHC